MSEVVIFVAAGAILVITTISGRLEKFWLTEPLIAAVFGAVLGIFFIGPVDLTEPAFLIFLELTLALVLFSDASRVSVVRVKGTYAWPARMLALGLPLAIGLGTAAAAWLLGLPLGFSLLLGVVLAPTDAALAEPVLENKSVPARVRQTLNHAHVVAKAKVTNAVPKGVVFLPFHWAGVFEGELYADRYPKAEGDKGESLAPFVHGDSANISNPPGWDPTTQMQSTKSGMCQVFRLDLYDHPWEKQGLVEEYGRLVKQNLAGR